MTDDLVKRLRELNTFEWHARPATTKETCFAAADRIEQLEAALREIADGARDVDKSYISLFHELQFEARAALGEKKND
jgi:hypothetical protein